MTTEGSPKEGAGRTVAMIFEFWFDPARPEIYQVYLRESADVRTVLEGHEGVLGVERYQSATDPNKFVAIGFLSDEAAVQRWRTAPEHRRVQALGRDRLFSHYRLRMADVTRDYDHDRRNQAPRDSRTFHDNPTAR